MNISIIGLGKLGLCIAGCFAKKHKIYGIDNNEDLITKLKNGICPIEEPKLNEFISNNIYGIEYVFSENKYNTSIAIANSDIVCIIVPTPSKSDDTFDNSYIINVLNYIVIPNLLDSCKTKKPIINIMSTVIPNSCSAFINYIYQEIKLKESEDYFLTYNPLFIALGSVIKNLTNPDLVLIGGHFDAANKIQKFHKTIIKNNPYYAYMSLINAEITKLSLNYFLTMKISFANELASLCEKIPDANVDIITEAIGYDKRIGHKLLNAGLGYGGPCLPRDIKAFKTFSKESTGKSHLANAIERIDKEIASRIVNFLEENIDGKNIGICGIAYKPNTHLIEDSYALHIIQNLIEYHDSKQILIYDPNVKYNSNNRKIQQINDFNSFVENSDIIILAVKHIIYESTIDWNLFENKIVIDCVRMMPEEYRKYCIKYHALGIGENL
jgi:UDPglucose 6-dehydrogenase